MHGEDMSNDDRGVWVLPAEDMILRLYGDCPTSENGIVTMFLEYQVGPQKSPLEIECNWVVSPTGLFYFLKVFHVQTRFGRTKQPLKMPMRSLIILTFRLPCLKYTPRKFKNIADHPKRKVLFQPEIFQGRAVHFQGSTTDLTENGWVGRDDFVPLDSC